SSSRLLTATFAALLASGIAIAQSQDGSGQSGGQPSSQSGSQSGSQGASGSAQDPASQPNINTPAPQHPAPPPADPNAKKNPGSDAPIQSPDTVNPKNSKEDVDAIGNRNVGKGINFYSLDKEMALAGSRALRQAGGRSGRHRIRQPRWPEPGSQLRCESSLHHQGDRLGRNKRLRPSRRLLLCEQRPDSPRSGR